MVYAYGILLTQILSACVVILTFVSLNYIPWLQKYSTLKFEVWFLGHSVCFDHKVTWKFKMHYVIMNILIIFSFL